MLPLLLLLLLLLLLPLVLLVFLLLLLVFLVLLQLLSLLLTTLPRLLLLPFYASSLSSSQTGSLPATGTKLPNLTLRLGCLWCASTDRS